VNRNRDQFRTDLRVLVTGFDRRRLLARLAAFPASLGLAVFVERESGDAKTGKNKKKRRKRRGGEGSNTGANPGTGGGGSSAGDSLDAEERACLDLINAHRAANGRGALAAQGPLTAAAERHAQDMAANGFFSHTGSDRTDGGQRIRQAGYVWTAWGENIYWNSSDDSANAAFTWWKNSRSHNANMLDAGFTEIGIARVRSASSGRWYWTTTFGRR
jgi:uncharacterized protein YkwD